MINTWQAFLVVSFECFGFFFLNEFIQNQQRIFKKNFLFLAVLGLFCFVWASLVAMSGGHSLVVVLGLIVVASLVAEHWS